MEMYTNSPAADRRVTIPFPEPIDSVDVLVYQDGKRLGEIRTVAVDPSNTISVTLPLALAQFDSELKIHWTIKYTDTTDYFVTDPEAAETYTINKTTPVQVVTPILSKTEIRDVWDNATEAEVVMIEKAVRHIIQAYTGQEFGHFVGDVEALGTGSDALYLPRRIISVESLDGIKNTGQLEVGAGGWVLKNYAWGVPPVKADYYGMHIHTGGVIHNPNNVKMSAFRNSKGFKVNGHWGWEEVPAAVKEAAKLLVNDYACADSQYRDRYLVSMTAADWRIQFNSGAYIRTGNVRADQLLSDYVVTRGWGVI